MSPRHPLYGTQAESNHFSTQVRQKQPADASLPIIVIAAMIACFAGTEAYFQESLSAVANSFQPSMVYALIGISAAVTGIVMACAWPYARFVRWLLVGFSVPFLLSFAVTLWRLFS